MKITNIFFTCQGEGSASGSPAVFVRFTGCNLWAGRSYNREKGRGQCAMWCDTWFAKGDDYTATEAADAVETLWPGGPNRVVVITGGEPMLQLRRREGEAFVHQLKIRNFEVHLETNGTIDAPVLSQIDHITVSPKKMKHPAGDPLDDIVVRRGTDLKVVDGQWTMSELRVMNHWKFEHRFIQPCDDDDGSGPDDVEGPLKIATKLGWTLSIQTHKLVGLE